jgi:hypothetical protein
MELLLTFEDPFSIIDFVQNVIEKKEADVRLFDDYLQIGEKLYYFRQLDSHSIYLGITKNPIIEKVKNHTVLSVKGSPKSLINIKGSRFVTAIIKMSETYQAFETLFDATESIELKVSRKNRKELVYTGEFRFETGESATNEFLKFMLSMESVR